MLKNREKRTAVNLMPFLHFKLVRNAMKRVYFSEGVVDSQWPSIFNTRRVLVVHYGDIYFHVAGDSMSS